MRRPIAEYDFTDAVKYHYNKFPPTELDYSKLIEPVAKATDALARYDQMLKSLHNSEFLLAPLRSQEALVSSRMEGTISTLDEVMRYEADHDEVDEPLGSETRYEAFEVALFGAAIKAAQKAMNDGQPLSESLIKQAHRTLLSFGRGAAKSPGLYKKDQNYIGDDRTRKVLFVPISPEQLAPSIEKLVTFMNSDDFLPLLISAIAHVEFEALHPFNDGNGRIGRLLITLSLWEKGVISQPHFYISAYLEEQKEEYIERMRAVSTEGDWTGWCVFMLEAICEQANRNLQTASAISQLYEEMKDEFREVLASQWATVAQDFIFSQPIFRNNRFTRQSGIPKATAAKFTRSLVDRGLLIEIIPASGRRAAMYAFEPLMEIVRT
ncbi:cell filamentation protein Fic [Amylibacter kogurei]|uniref:Cell filamentation protein Fic n=1 Tax=Paramylibacter kogurei TaxID=1889778 RepID=A0A2G5KDN5_9RHOB|nr:Fic/DOC family N-terminal domain-containing protein [Amylibacter kogurei]PIB26714.1 cell filamentation protein Fic [Amylibacter kogurei]